MLDKEELKKIFQLKGETRGVVFQTDAQYILMKEGEDGLKELEKRAAELGFKIPYRTVKPLDWEPIGLRIISLLLIQDTFGWSDSKIREMGYFAPNVSFIIKLLMKYFVSIEKTIKNAPRYWVQHHTVGELIVDKADQKQKEIIIRMKAPEFHPIFYTYLEGYYERVARFTNPDMVCQHSKTIIDGELFHIYKIKW